VHHAVRSAKVTTLSKVPRCLVLLMFGLAALWDDVVKVGLSSFLCLQNSNYACFSQAKTSETVILIGIADKASETFLCCSFVRSWTRPETRGRQPVHPPPKFSNSCVVVRYNKLQRLFPNPPKIVQQQIIINFSLRKHQVVAALSCMLQKHFGHSVWWFPCGRELQMNFT